jgi:hypothetical protein
MLALMDESFLRDSRVQRVLAKQNVTIVNPQEVEEDEHGFYRYNGTTTLVKAVTIALLRETNSIAFWRLSERNGAFSGQDYIYKVDLKSKGVPVLEGMMPL